MRMRKKAEAETKNLRERHYHPDEPDKDDAPKIE